MPNVNDNPKPPVGFTAMRDSEVTPAMSAFAVEVFHDPVKYQMFATADREFSETIRAVVEWHPPDFQNGAVHRGVTLYRARSPSATLPPPSPVVVPPVVAPPVVAPPVVVSPSAPVVVSPSAPVGTANPRMVGADTAYPVTQRLLEDATRVLRIVPAFWGRYFTSRSAPGNVEYRHKLEDALLAANNIRVLPIARQTNRVGLTEDAGRADGQANADDLLITFTEEHLAANGGQFMVFLDVEGNGKSHLAAAYYKGWVDGLNRVSSKVQFLPCVYGIPSDVASWNALIQARAANVACSGVWLAHWVNDLEPVAWQNSRTTPSPNPGVPVLAWQYTSPRDGAAIDRTVVNPAIDAEREFLNFLIPPRA